MKLVNVFLPDSFKHPYNMIEHIGDSQHKDTGQNSQQWNIEW